MVQEAAQFEGTFSSIAIGAPLLTSDEDFLAVANTLVESTASYDDGNTAICFMGHGTEAASNGVYARMQQVLRSIGKENYFIGTVEAVPSVENVLTVVQRGNYARVLLQPMMIVAGDHANNDMAGEGKDSWKGIFESAGYQVECQVLGLGELEAIQQLLVKHAQAAMEVLAAQKAEAVPV